MKTLIPMLAASVLAAAIAPRVSAQNILQNGDLETPVAPSGWVFDASIPGLPGASINATESVVFANSPNDVPVSGLAIGLFLRPFAGNVGTYAGQNRSFNMILSQEIAATPNRTYTFTGDHLLPVGYSGAVNVLDILSPSDTEKPSDFNFNNDVDGSDLLIWQRNYLFPEGASKFEGDATGDAIVDGIDLESWKATTGYGLAPGTYPSPTVTQFKMEFFNNTTPVGTPVVVDLKTGLTIDTWQTRSLVGMSPANANRVRVTVAATEVIENEGSQNTYFDNFKLQRDGDGATTNRLTNGNLNAPGNPAGWTITEMPDGADSTTGFRDFANHTTGGQQGLWLRSFSGGDGEMSQVVNAAAGTNYTFKAWSKWEAGYSGDEETFPGTTTQTLMELTFLNSLDAIIGTPSMLDLDAAGQNNDNTWRQFTLAAVAPAGTAKVRVAVKGVDMINSGVDPQSAFFDDLTLTTNGSIGAIPEPTTAAAAGLAALLLASRCRRRASSRI